MSTDPTAESLPERRPGAPPRRLQLGASRLEDLDVSVLEHFLDDSWLHLGDASPPERAPRLARWAGQLRRHPVRFAGLVLRELSGRSARPRRSPLPAEALYARTRFEPFYFRKEDRLAFPDASFDYIFSEHFLHHLFFDEGLALLRECHRILRPRGVVRTVVPDADLRTYAPPEPAGYPDVRESFLSPLKHKTRYSVYMLSEALRLAGFTPVPLRYCDREGRYVRRDPAELRDTYRGCPETTLVFDLSHVIRIDSLIVDGIKPGDGEALGGAERGR
jgi:predicted SAM-dependent methyltransferase